jgi:hypothetical protein
MNMANNKPVKWKPPALQDSPVTPAQMLQMAVAQGADLDKLERLMGLQERWEANQAKKAYATAMAAFKANPPQLLKNKHVRYANSKGGFTEYDHATHDQVTDKIVAALVDHRAADPRCHQGDVHHYPRPWAFGIRVHDVRA